MLSMDDIYTAPWFQPGYSAPSLARHSDSSYPDVQLTPGTYMGSRRYNTETGPSTSHKASQLPMHGSQSRWHTDSHGRMHYVESSVIGDFGELGLEDHSKRRPRVPATRSLHAHLPSNDFEKFAHVLTDPLPEHTTPPPKPRPHTLDFDDDDLPMPGGYPSSTSKYQHPWTSGGYQQTPSYSSYAAKDTLDPYQSSSLLTFSPSLATKSASSSGSPPPEKPHIAQPQPKRVVRVDILEKNGGNIRHEARSSLRYPDSGDVQEIATQYTSRMFSDFLRHDQDGADSAHQLDQLSLSNTRAHRPLRDGARRDSGYQSDPEDSVALLPPLNDAHAPAPHVPSTTVTEDWRRSDDYLEHRVPPHHISSLPPPKNVNAPASQEAFRTLNLVDITLERLQHFTPSFDDLESALVAAQACLQRRCSLSPEEWNIHSEAWYKKYQRRVESMEGLVHEIDESIQVLYLHPDNRGQAYGTDIWKQLSRSGELLIGVSSKLEDSFDRLQIRYLDHQSKARASSQKTKPPMRLRLRS
ncbi:hypothetical protein FPV67DRAFT_1523484 [Lyophyllum atratum]|nr:hypothetical protein FPV67DRAFT_1523484 [Lyophyllum atratum]